MIQEFLPEFRYLDRDRFVRYMQMKDHKALSGYYRTIPSAVREEVSRYEDRRWHMFNLFARCPGALDLSQSNPALCFALASNWVFHKPAVQRPMRAARSLIGKKQRCIMEWVGFPPTESARSILAKIVPQSLAVEGLLYLRDALRDGDLIKLLSHLERINAGVLRIATDPRFRDHRTPRLLQAIGQEKEYDGARQSRNPIFWIFRDTLAMAEMIEWRNCPRKFISLQRLKSLHDQLSRRMNAGQILRNRNLPDRFPAPPFAGTPEIIPITTPAELCQEGVDMHHCAGAHVMSVARKSEYVYRVLSPVRATLSVHLVRGRWKEGELFQARNVPVEEAVARQLFQRLMRT